MGDRRVDRRELRLGVGGREAEKVDEGTVDEATVGNNDDGSAHVLAGNPVDGLARP